MKYIHDTAVTLKWEFCLDSLTARGTVRAESDGDGDWEFTVEVENTSDSSLRATVQDLIKSENRGVQPFVVSKLTAVETEFRQISLAK